MRLEPPVIVADGARIADAAEVGPEVVVGGNATIGKGARVALTRIAGASSAASDSVRLLTAALAAP